jgi:hypothetical protein
MDRVKYDFGFTFRAVGEGTSQSDILAKSWDSSLPCRQLLAEMISGLPLLLTFAPLGRKHICGVEKGKTRFRASARQCRAGRLSKK